MIAFVAASCGGDDDGVLTVWTNESQPDRMKSPRRSWPTSLKKTRIKAKLVPVPEDQLATLTINAAAAGDLPDVVLATPIGDSHTYAKEELFDAEAAQEVVERLGKDTFSERALSLVSNPRSPTALLVVIAFESWKSFPFAFLFILARLQAAPRELEEAAQVDGATPTQVFWHIILPQLMGVIALIAVLRFIFTFNAFDEIYLLTGGGAGTEVLATQVYSLLTARADVGASAAVAMCMAAVLSILLVLYLRFFGETERPA